MRITQPNYTQTPNDLFDHWLPHLSEGELKVLLVIMRKTFGWHKKRDRISISQLAKITGMKEETVINASKSLQGKGIINRVVIGEIGRQSTYYELVIHEDSNNSYPLNERGGPPQLEIGVQMRVQKKLSSKEEEEEEEEKKEEKKHSSSAASTSSASEDFDRALQEFTNPDPKDDYENFSELLEEKHGLIISPFALRKCKKKYGGKILKKVIDQMQREPSDLKKDKSAIFTSLCKELYECK